jgi:hypothetical protein
MKNLNVIVIVYFILFCFSSIAQTDKIPSTTKGAKNSGLIFKKELEHRLTDSSYTDVIQLLKLKDKAQSLQFRILINKSADDNIVLILKDIQKGSDLKDPGWLLDYNVVKGLVTKNGASNDEVYVVLYNSNHNGGLLPGDYSDLIKVNYKVVYVPTLKNEIKSSMKIAHAKASTIKGISINITPTRDEFKIYARCK